MNNYMFANDDDQECSSGCESGWTSYLEHSSSSPYVSCNNNHNQVHDYDIDGRRRRRRNNGGFAEAKRSKEDDDEDEEEEDEDEDLSMVSDASSGPPHYGDQNGANGCIYKYAAAAAIDDVTTSRNNLNRKKNRESNRRRIKPGSSLLDDTASSPFFDFSDKCFSQPPAAAEKVLDYSQGYSSTVQFEVRPPYHQEQYDFFQSPPQYSGNHLHQNQWFEG